MKTGTIALGALLALAGCQVQSEEAQLENAIRDGLANQGTIEEINLVQENENSFAGYAMVRGPQGGTGRFNCTAQRGEGTNFNWRCAQVIDETVLREVEASIRERFSQQAQVAEVDMQRAGDDDHMSGSVLLQDGMGGEARVPCTAQRSEGSSFDWRCGENVAAGQPAAGAK